MLVARGLYYLTSVVYPKKVKHGSLCRIWLTQHLWRRPSRRSLPHFPSFLVAMSFCRVGSLDLRTGYFHWFDGRTSDRTLYGRMGCQEPRMKITAINTFVLKAELKRPFGYSQGKFSRRQTMLAEVETDEGISGWGESYSPPQPVAAAVREFFAPMLLGRDPRQSELLWQMLYARSLDYGREWHATGRHQRAGYCVLGHQRARGGGAPLPTAGRLGNRKHSLLCLRVLFRRPGATGEPVRA